jgi:hypothetical protein
VTSVSGMVAFIKVKALIIISSEDGVEFVTKSTSAVITWYFVVAFDHFTSTSVCTNSTFIDVNAIAPSSFITGQAFTFV